MIFDLLTKVECFGHEVRALVLNPTIHLNIEKLVNVIQVCQNIIVECVVQNGTILPLGGLQLLDCLIVQKLNIQVVLLVSLLGKPSQL